MQSFSPRQVTVFFFCLFVTLLYLGFNFERAFLPLPLSAGGDAQDYAAYFGASRYEAGSGLNIYDPVAFQTLIGIQTTLLWLFPPTALLLFEPFGGLSYAALKMVLVCMTLASAATMAFGIARGTAGRLVGLASPAVIIALLVGQISVIFCAMLYAGLVLARSHPWLGGLFLGLLTIKPSYGLMVIPYLVVIRAWRCIAWASLTALALGGLSLMVLGPEPWRHFLDSLSGGTLSAFLAQELEQFERVRGRVTLNDALIGLGVTPPSIMVTTVALWACAIAGLMMIARHASERVMLAYTFLATACVAPYFWVYDYQVVAVAALLLAFQTAPLPRPLSWLLLIIWFAPLSVFFLSGPVNAVLWSLNVLAAVLVVLFARRHLAGENANTLTSGSR